ncbi:hypothetical protein CB1_000331041 [Camelus ferus]|nr:hypothetical protein CB1_000331041 [Camelus ferus]
MLLLLLSNLLLSWTCADVTLAFLLRSRRALGASEWRPQPLYLIMKAPREGGPGARPAASELTGNSSRSRVEGTLTQRAAGTLELGCLVVSGPCGHSLPRRCFDRGSEPARHLPGATRRTPFQEFKGVPPVANAESL